jgi:putative transcriptional regulator
MKREHILLWGGAKSILLLLSITALLATAPAARADSPSDLMEQGIYSNETTGDLTSAEQLKVIAQTINAFETEKYDPSLPLAFEMAWLFKLPIEQTFTSDKDQPNCHA